MERGEKTGRMKEREVREGEKSEEEREREETKEREEGSAGLGRGMKNRQAMNT